MHIKLIKLIKLVLFIHVICLPKTKNIENTDESIYTTTNELLSNSKPTNSTKKLFTISLYTSLLFLSIYTISYIYSDSKTSDTADKPSDDTYRLSAIKRYKTILQEDYYLYTHAQATYPYLKAFLEPLCKIHIHSVHYIKPDNSEEVITYTFQESLIRINRNNIDLDDIRDLLKTYLTISALEKSAAKVIIKYRQNIYKPLVYKIGQQIIVNL